MRPGPSHEPGRRAVSDVMIGPNILVIISDQHNPRVCGCCGDPVAQTPNIDRLASQGVIFDNAYCGSPLCVPSRSTMLTGRSCSELSVWTNKCVLPSSVPTFAHSLAASGYETALIGRMHFTGPDVAHGFGLRRVGDVSPAWGTGRWAVLDGLPPRTNGQEYISAAVSGAGRTGYQEYDADVAAAAVDWIAGRTSASPPFCAVVGFVLPHNPYVASPEWYDYYLPRVADADASTAFRDTAHPAVRAWLDSRQTGLLTAEQARSARAAYYGLVSMMDEQVGAVVGALDTAGLREDTVVIYASDHGDMVGEHGMWWKSNCYEGAARVPLVVSWPGQFSPGARVEDPVSLIDLAPTIVDLGRGAALPGASGRVLTPLLRGEPLPAGTPEEIYLENVPEWAPSARMVRRGRHKLVRHHGYDRPQLFDLITDPGETDDLAGSASHADVESELDALVRVGWDPDGIDRQVRQHHADRAAISAWAHATRPDDDGVWPRAGESNLNRVVRLVGPACGHR